MYVCVVICGYVWLYMWLLCGYMSVYACGYVVMWWLCIYPNNPNNPNLSV